MPKSSTCETTAQCIFLAILTGTISACGGGGGGEPAPAPVPVPPALTELTTDNPSISEGNSGTSQLDFSVNLDKADTSDISVDYATADNTATAGSDYVTATGTLVIPAGSTSATISVTVTGDFDVETDDVLNLNLSNISANATLGTPSATGTIVNDDFPIVTLAPATVVEGDNGTADLIFTVSMNVDAIGDVTVDYASSDLLAVAGEDYTLTSGVLIIPEGSVAATITVPVTGEIFLENDETLSMVLSNLSVNARFGVDNAIGTIINDDFPFLAIVSSSVTEGDSGVEPLSFSVSLAEPVLGAVMFDYATSDNSAIQPVDYLPASGTITINQGDTIATISVDIVGDTVVEGSETFFLTLSNVVGNATLNPTATIGVGTISDNDAVAPTEPTVTVNSASVVEGNTPDTVSMVFIVSVSPTDSSSISFDYATEDVAGAALAGTDYSASGGTLTIPANADTGAIIVNIIGDDDIEDDEIFSLLLSGISSNARLHAPQVGGLIVDDDDSTQTQPRLNISNATIFEGDSGSGDMQFSVSLTEAATNDVSVDYQFEDINAVNGSDYIGTGNTVTIIQGDTSALISVQVLGDTLIEADETFRVTLSNLLGDATLNDAEGIGTIFTDDPFAAIDISDAGVQEGDAGTVDMVFTVTLDVQAADTVTVDYTTSDISATGGDDYVAVTGTLLFPPGDIEATITITVNGDTDLEGDEQFNVILSNVSANGTLDNTMAIGSISNDDGFGWGIPSLLELQDDFTRVDGAQITTGANGDAMVTWGSGIPDDLMARRFSSAGIWEPALRVDRHPSGETVPVTVDGNGNANIVWYKFNVSAGYYDVDASTWLGTVEVQPATIDGGVLGLISTATDFKLAGNEAGDAMAVWKEESHPNGSAVDNVWYARYTPLGGWQAPGLVENNTVANAGGQDVAMDEAGNAIVVWLEQDVTVFHLYANRYDAVANSWSGPQLIEDLAGSAESPRIAINASGDAVVVWTQDGTIWANRYDFDPGIGAGSWLILPEQVQQTVGNSLLPDVTIDAAGNAIAVWVLQDINDDAYANRFDAGTGSWSDADESLEAAGGRVYEIYTLVFHGIRVAGDPLGNAIVIWGQDSEEVIPVIDIRANRYSVTDGSWSGPETIDDQTDSAQLPDIALDADGNAIAIWVQDHDSDNDGSSRPSLWSNRFIAP